MVDDVIVLEVLLQLLDIVNLHHHAQAFAEEHEEGVDQGLGGLATNISFLPFDVLLHLLIRQALDLFVCELHADGLFCLASRNEDGQLFALGGDVVAGCYETREPCGLGGVRLSLHKLHDISQSFLLLGGGHHVYNMFVFQISNIIRQRCT